MSGGIPQAAGPTNARLQGILATLPVLLQPTAGAAQQGVQHQLENSLAAHQYALHRPNEATTLLSTREDQRIELFQRPSIDGEPPKLARILELYKSATDSQPIPELQKLVHLKSCSKGSAAALIRVYALRTHDYTTIVEALKKGYEHPEATMNSLYDELDDLPRSREGELAELIENIDRILELLAHQGEPTITRPIQRIIERKLLKKVLEKLEQAKAVTRD
uniref:Uncharacterized protein n=1 Tax=Ascaris lumbricoides TaxID=6252 RepID=A0A0M3IG58_ASCLU